MMRFTILKSNSVDGWHDVGYDRKPNGEFRLVDLQEFCDEYPVIVVDETFDSEREVVAAFETRIEHLAQQGFVVRIPHFNARRER